MSSRTSARGKFTDPVRISLLETDADELDSDMAGLKAQINRLTWTLAGAAVTMATASVLFALNLSVMN